MTPFTRDSPLVPSNVEQALMMVPRVARTSEDPVLSFLCSLFPSVDRGRSPSTTQPQQCQARLCPAGIGRLAEVIVGCNIGKGSKYIDQP